MCPTQLQTLDWIHFSICSIKAESSRALCYCIRMQDCNKLESKHTSGGAEVEDEDGHTNYKIIGIL